MTDHLTLGQALRIARSVNGLTLVQASVRSGVSREQIMNLENGANDGRNPTLNTMRALTRVYHLEYEFWFAHPLGERARV